MIGIQYAPPAEAAGPDGEGGDEAISVGEGGCVVPASTNSVLKAGLRPHGVISCVLIIVFGLASWWGCGRMSTCGASRGPTRVCAFLTSGG